MPEPQIDPQDPEGAVPTPPKEEPKGISEEEFRKMAERAERSEAALNEERYRRQSAETGYQSLAQQRQSEIEAAQRAQSQHQIPPPPIDWSKFDEYGEPVADALSKVSSWTEQRILSTLAPYIDAVQKSAATQNLTTGAATTIALDKTRKDWEQRGFSQETWEKIEPEMKRYLSGNQRAIEAAMVDGGGVTTAFWFADQKKLPIASAKRDPEPVSTSGSPASSGSRSPAFDDPEVNRYVQTMCQKLGIDPSEITEDDREQIAAAYQRGM